MQEKDRGAKRTHMENGVTGGHEGLNGGSERWRSGGGGVQGDDAL